MPTERRAAAVYLRLLVGALAAALAVAIVGALPARKLAGEEGLVALVVGCGVTLAASAVSAIPLSRALERSDPQARLLGLLVAMGLRFGFVLAALLVLLGGGWFRRNPMLIGIALSYLAVLAIETRFTVAGLANGRRG
jgi:hypothetical protein